MVVEVEVVVTMGLAVAAGDDNGWVAMNLVQRVGEFDCGGKEVGNDFYFYFFILII